MNPRLDPGFEDRWADAELQGFLEFEEELQILLHEWEPTMIR